MFSFCGHSLLYNSLCLQQLDALELCIKLQVALWWNLREHCPIPHMAKCAHTYSEQSKPPHCITTSQVLQLTDIPGH